MKAQRVARASAGLASDVQLTQGPIVKHLARLVGPMFVGMALFSSVGLVDAYCIADLGPDVLAGFGFAFPVAMIAQMILFGFGSGITSAAARAFGASQFGDVRQIVELGIASTLGLAALLAAILYGCHSAVFSVLGAPHEVSGHASRYLQLYLITLLIVAFPLSVTAALRALGETGSSAAIMLIASVVNAALDFVFVRGCGFVPAMGLPGAAAAAALGSGVAGVAAIFVLNRRLALLGKLSRSDRRGLNQAWRHVCAILHVGLPAMFSQALGPVALAILTALVAAFGTSAVAGYAVVSRVEMVVLMMPMAIATSLEPMVAQNWGACKRERAGLALMWARRGAALWALLAWLVLGSQRGRIAAAFVDDPAVLQVVAMALLIRPLGFIPGGMTTATASAFNAIGRASRATQLSLLFALTLLPGFGYVGGRLYSLGGLFSGTVVASWIAATVAWHWMRREGLASQPRPSS